MPIFTKAGIYGTLLGDPDPVLKAKEKLDIADDRISLGPVGNFLDRVYHNTFHTGTFADLHRRSERSRTATGTFPSFTTTKREDILASEAYRMLLEDAKNSGHNIRELPLEDIRRKGYSLGFDYEADGLEYNNVIEIGSTLPTKRKLEVLAHEYAAKFKRAEGKQHVHRYKDGEFLDDEFFQAGREIEQEYISRAVSALHNQN